MSKLTMDQKRFTINGQKPKAKPKKISESQLLRGYVLSRIERLTKSTFEESY